MALTGQQFTIQAGEHRAVIVEVGAGLRSYTVADAHVTCTYDDDILPPKAVGIVLVPWTNRIRDGRYSFAGTDFQLGISEPSKNTAIHGLGRWHRWAAIGHDAAAVTMALDIVPQSGWPFELRAEVTYALDAAHGLRVTGEVRNVGQRAAPFGAGFHPYVSARGARVDDLTLAVPAATRLLLDDRGLPTGRAPVAGSAHDFREPRRLGALRMDDAFADVHHERADGTGVVSVRGPSGGAEIWFDDTFGYLQIFTLDDLGNGQAGVAVEPMTCPADAFNSGEALQVLEPGRSWTGTWGIRPM